MNDDDSYAPFWSHLEELRLACLKMIAIIACGVILGLVFHQLLIAFLTSPLQGQIESDLSPQIFSSNSTNSSLVILGPLDGFLTTLKICLWVGAVGTSPFWLFVLFRFLSPGMRAGEKQLIIPFLAISALFILIGMSFAFWVTIPVANQYLMAFNQGIGINLWTLSQYLDYTLFLLLANGLAFELCAIGLFSVHLGIVSADSLISKRRYAIVGALILGALLTPPDVLTQLMLAIPLMGLYEIVILFARMRKRSTKLNN